jgi:hypothetical protein
MRRSAAAHREIEDMGCPSRMAEPQRNKANRLPGGESASTISPKTIFGRER